MQLICTPIKGVHFITWKNIWISELGPEDFGVVGAGPALVRGGAFADTLQLNLGVGFTFGRHSLPLSAQFACTGSGKVSRDPTRSAPEEEVGLSASDGTEPVVLQDFDVRMRWGCGEYNPYEHGISSRFSHDYSFAGCRELYYYIPKIQ